MLKRALQKGNTMEILFLPLFLLVIVAGYFLNSSLPDILKRRDDIKLEIEQEKTKRAQAQLEAERIRQRAHG